MARRESEASFSLCRGFQEICSNVRDMLDLNHLVSAFILQSYSGSEQNSCGS